jgi:hypothetical protein
MRKTILRPSSIKHAAAAFLVSLVFLTIMFMLCQNGPWFVTPVDGSETPTDVLPAEYDSRLFLLPLQQMMQVFLRLLPFFQSANASAVFLTILFSSLTVGLIVLAAQHAGLHPAYAWALAGLVLSNPDVIRANTSGSGVSILIFFVLLALTYLLTWQAKRYWLALVWIGLGAALAVAAQFSSLIFLLLPVLAALIIAFREMPDDVYYAENARWIMATPLIYVFMIRFFFGYALTGNSLAFYTLEGGLAQSAGFRQGIDLPFLPRLIFMAGDNFATLWRLHPPFILISDGTILISAFKRRAFPVLFAGMLWLPLLVLLSARQVGFYGPGLIIPNFAIPATMLMVILATRQFKRFRWVVLAVSILVLAAWNGVQWATLLLQTLR